MSKRELKKRLSRQSTIKWEFVEETLSDHRVDQLEKQLKRITMSEDKDGDTVVPCSDIRTALNNPGVVV